MEAVSSYSGPRWHEDAVCRKPPVRGADFFPDNRRSVGAKLAKQLCGVCRARVACLSWALANDERFGIWGGTDRTERQWLKDPILAEADVEA